MDAQVYEFTKKHCILTGWFIWYVNYVPIKLLTKLFKRTGRRVVRLHGLHIFLLPVKFSAPRRLLVPHGPGIPLSSHGTPRLDTAEGQRERLDQMLHVELHLPIAGLPCDGQRWQAWASLTKLAADDSVRIILSGHGTVFKYSPDPSRMGLSTRGGISGEHWNDPCREWSTGSTGDHGQRWWPPSGPGSPKAEGAGGRSDALGRRHFLRFLGWLLSSLSLSCPWRREFKATGGDLRPRVHSSVFKGARG